MEICEQCGGSGWKVLPGAGLVPCPECTSPEGRWGRFTDQELAVIVAALRSIGTTCGAQMCGEIAHEQAVRRPDPGPGKTAAELFDAGRKIIAESK